MKTGTAACTRTCACICVSWALVSGGCAPLGTAAVDDADWRPAQIVAIGRASELAATASRDCGPIGDADPYVLVRYHSSGVHSRSLGTGHVPPGASLQVGDIVFVNIRDCDAPLAMQAPALR